MLNFMMIGYTELILIVIVFLLIFGGKKIPELMRGLGSGVKSFKEGLKDGDKQEEKKEEEKK